MFTGLRVEAVEQHRVSGAVFPLQFELWIVHDNVAIVTDGKFLAYLQNDLRACAWCRHESSPAKEVLYLLACLGIH